MQELDLVRQEPKLAHQHVIIKEMPSNQKDK